MNQTKPATSSEVFASFIALLHSADVITLDGGPYLGGWHITETTGDAENEVLTISWESEGEQYSVSFTEGGIAGGAFDPNGTFVCNDTTGNSYMIDAFSLKQLSPAGEYPTSHMAEVMMQDIVGEYDDPRNVPAWQWVEQNHSFAHKDNGTNGVWEFVVNLSRSFSDIPAELFAVIQKAKAEGKHYVMFHQGT